MDHDRRHGHHYVNGMSRPVERKKEQHNYKLVVDPFLHKGHSQKVYRFDGVVPGENRQVSVRDPRSRITRLWTRQQQADLPVPKFKYDEFYVGIPPPKEVTLTNLNDNINKDFLENMCKGFGKMEEIKIYFHPKTKKHMGIGKVLFCSSKAAKACVDKLNQTSKMGNIMNVFIDTMGRERNRIIEELTIERLKHGSVSDSRNSGSDTVYPDTEAYDPGDTFDVGMGPPEQEYTPSVETDYSGYSEGGYSVPQSELSFSSQDTGYSSGTNVMNMGYQRDDYSQYPGEHHPPRGPPHGPPQGNKYYQRHGHHFGGGQHQQQHHHHRHHQPPATPSHHHPPPQTPHSLASTPHYSILGDINNSRYAFYAPPPSPGTPFNRPPPPLPPEPQPLMGGHPDHSFQDPRGYHGELSRHNQSKQKRRPEREPLPTPPRPQTPPAADSHSDEPRFESLESRIASLLQNVHGLGSPDHASSSSQDEATPSHTSAQEMFDYHHQPPVSEPLPPLPEHPPECDDVARLSPRERLRMKHESRDSPVNYPTMEENSRDQFDGVLLDSQTVVEETVNTEPNATPAMDSVCSETPREGEEVNTPNVSVSTKVAEGGGENEEDDRMSLSSISSGEEKMEINAPLPATGNSSSSPAQTNYSQSPMQSVQSSSPVKPVTSSWQNNTYPDTSLMSNNAYIGLMSSPPPVGFGGMTVPGYQGNVYGMPGLIGSRLTDNDPSDQTFSTVLDKFVKELKQVMQKDLCKKMVENSAFKSFEHWWDTEVKKTKQPQKIVAIADETPAVVPTSVKAKPGVKPEMSASLASLFESKERPGMDSGVGYGGFLGIRGGMPKMPSFKRKFRPPSPPPEEDEDLRKPEAKSADEDSDKEEIAGPKIKKPVISESDEEESESSDEEKDEESADEEDDEDYEGGEEEEEGSEESSEEESDEEEDSDESDQEEESDEEDEVKATTSDLVDKADVTLEKKESVRERSMEVETVKKSDEDADVDVVSSGDEDKSLHTDKEADSSRDADDSEVSSMDTDEDASPSKDSPGKRPLSPIMEEREKEELETKKGPSEPEDKTTATTTASEVTDSSTVDSDSSAVLPPGRVRSKVVKVVKVFTKDGVDKELRPSEASPVLKELIQRGPMMSDKSSSEESEQKMPSTSVLTDGEEVGNEEEVEASSNKMSISESEAEQRSNFMVPAIAEHDYFTFRPVEKEDSGADTDRTESADEDSEPLSEHLMDHNYSLPPLVEQVRLSQLVAKQSEVKAAQEAKDTKKKARVKKSRNSMLSDITNKTEKKISRELVNLLPPIKPIPKFKCRTIQEEREIFFDIYSRGIAEEDVKYLKRTYDDLIQSDDPNFYWLNDILWVDHTQTDIPDVLPISPPKKKKKTEDHVPKPHSTGSARTEGYYKLSMLEKSSYLRHAHNLQIQQKAAEDLKKLQETGKKGQTSREARHNNRRLQTTYSDLETDLLRFNQLKFRKKQLRFAKSGIHDWGLFALEPIASEEMVIEYVGQVVRQSIADEREKRYEAIGIGSSYLFRVDTETIIDATKTGNLARFINHSCNPNCYAKIITVESQKKIVIYSKRDIDVNEEITYDYKFPIEDEKIPCLCMSQGCRGTLN